MSLVIGGNTYFNIEEADQIVEKEFLENTTESNYWLGLSDTAKEVVIKNGTRVIDKCLFRGHKTRAVNIMSFPRIINTITYEFPYELKIAVLEQGIRSAIDRSKKESILSDLGVKSYGVDGASITFEHNNYVKLSNGVYRDIYNNYLAQWTY